MTLRLLADLNAFERRNGAEDVTSVIATLAANCLQQQQRKHVPFKETASAGTVGFLPATSAAVEFLEKSAP